jgi:SWIM zinc finger
MEPSELERWARDRALAERVRVVKLAGTNRYLARSRTVEPGSYFELYVSPWGRIRCSCAAFDYRGICKHVAALKMRLAREKQRHEAV